MQHWQNRRHVEHGAIRQHTTYKHPNDGANIEGAVVRPRRTALCRLTLVIASVLELAILAFVTGAETGSQNPAGAGPIAAEMASGNDDLAAWQEWFGGWAYLVAPLLMVVVAILPIPAELPAMMNGLLFGAVLGTAITWLGSILGAMISFELARQFGRPLAERFIRIEFINWADRVVGSAGWVGLLLLRLTPVFAFTAINWGAGLTAIPRWLFIWTTALGILPGAVLFTSSGMGLMALLRMNRIAVAALAVVVVPGISYMIVRYRRRTSAWKSQGRPGGEPNKRTDAVDACPGRAR